MSYSQAMQMLVDEHTVIQSVLDAVERRAQSDIAAGTFEAAFYEKAFDFFPAFADKCHHAKEEDQLFPKLIKAGLSREIGPMACMLHEHTQGRALVAGIRASLPKAAAGDRPARDTLLGQALAYVGLLREHIEKENKVLFVLADRLLSEADQGELFQEFQCRHHGPLPPEAHEKYERLAEELSATAAAMG